MATGLTTVYEEAVKRGRSGMSEPIARTQDLLACLRELGVEGVDDYERKLTQNASQPEVHRDLVSEGLAAAMFARNGLGVQMRDSPDLLLRVCDQILGAEIKHIRWKMQDSIDEERLGNAGEDLVELIGTEATEGQTAWDSIATIAEKKATQCLPDVPNLLVIESSSSHNVECGEVLTAAHEIDDRIGAGRTELARWSGLLLMDMWVTAEGRSIHLFPLERAAVPLGGDMEERLHAIRRRVWV